MNNLDSPYLAPASTEAPGFFATDAELDDDTARESIRDAVMTLNWALDEATPDGNTGEVRSKERDEDVEKALVELCNGGYAHLLRKVYEREGSTS